MKITLKNVPLTESQKEELQDALQCIANLIMYAYDAGHNAGVLDERKANEGN